MAQDLFTGSAATALTTHDANWKAGATGVNDGVTGAQLDGSGNLQNTAFKFTDAYYDDGTTGANSVSHITVPAGVPIDGVSIISAACRMTSSVLGYQARILSTTNVNTNCDKVDLYRLGAYVATWNPTSINANTTALDLTIKVNNTVDVVVTINGQSHTFAGSGGNDASGSAVLTGGFPGLSIYNNAGTASVILISAWTDDVASGGSTAGRNRMLMGFG